MLTTRLSESDSSNDASENEGTPFPEQPPPPPPNTTTSTIQYPKQTPSVPFPLPIAGVRLETSDRMSKEKQKFFRSSVFNKEKRREKDKFIEKKIESSGSESESSGSSTSGSSEESSSASDSDTEQSSDAKLTRNNSVIKTKHENFATFGSVSGLNLDMDVWGFAAAAAQVQKSQKKDPDTAVKIHKPGFGQLKGLFDGLSHLYAASNESRCRTVTPNYNLNRRKRTSEKENIENNNNVAKQEPEPAKVSRPASHSTLVPTSITTQPYIQPIMTPSDLVKTAVNSKRHELERRRFLGLPSSMFDEPRLKKRSLLADQIRLPAAPDVVANNQTGKIGVLPHSTKHVPFRILLIYQFSPISHPPCYISDLFACNCWFIFFYEFRPSRRNVWVGGW